jgi:hypothetical protein
MSVPAILQFKQSVSAQHVTDTDGYPVIVGHSLNPSLVKIKTSLSF